MHLALIGFGAMLWRVVYVLHWKGHDSDLSDEGDAFYYSAQAVANTRGRFFQHPIFGGAAADHPPLTALLVTPVSWIDAHVVLAQRLTMTLVGSAAVVVIGLVGRRVAGQRAGLLAAAIAATYAALWMNDGLVMAEALAALFTAVLLLITLDLYERPTLQRCALFGAVVGLATLARAELLLLLPLLGIPPLLRAEARRLRRSWRSAAAGLAACGLVLLPWVAWNLTRFEEPTLLSTNDGLTILGANCESTYFSPAIGFWDLRCALEAPASGDQSQVSAAWRQDGLTFARANLGRVPKVALARAGRVWGVYEPRQMVFFNDGEGREAWASWVGIYQAWALFPVAVVGGLVLRRRRASVAPFLATAISVTATAVLFYGIARFRVPADVSGAVLAGVAGDALLLRWGAWRRSRLVQG